MRISELSRTTGVPVATVKYYVREGLVPRGDVTSRTQASYGPQHAARVRLVRALSESAGLSLAAVREVLAVLDEPRSRHDLLGAAQHALLLDESGAGAPDADAQDPASPGVEDEATRRARRLAADRGWYEDPLLVHRLAGQLRAAAAADVPVADEHLAVLASAAEEAAAGDVASVPGEPSEALRQVVLGTLLTDPVLLTMRRFAQQRASAAGDGADAAPRAV
ncbi:MerR family transcriptional regulator [Isoptericola aurantiacus]|uniref:MerR family transcriptional regulator n=1 Tax=Isoptericola aurantiacus TaxID=3377839 RepID=UPI00383AA253